MKEGIHEYTRGYVLSINLGYMAVVCTFCILSLYILGYRKYGEGIHEYTRGCVLSINLGYMAVVCTFCILSLYIFRIQKVQRGVQIVNVLDLKFPLLKL